MRLTKHLFLYCFLMFANSTCLAGPYCIYIYHVFVKYQSHGTLTLVAKDRESVILYKLEGGNPGWSSFSFYSELHCLKKNWKTCSLHFICFRCWNPVLMRTLKKLIVIQWKYNIQTVLLVQIARSENISSQNCSFIE